MIIQVRELKSHLMFGFFAVILLFVQAYPAMAQSGDHVVINEADINPSGDDTKLVAEWVELYNPTNQTANVGGWTIAAATGIKTTYKIPAGTQLESGEFLTYAFGPLWFPDVSATVQLKNNNGTVIDQTPALSDTENNLKSWQRITDGFDTDSTTDWTFKASNAGSSNGKISSTATQSSLAVIVSTDKAGYIFGETVKITGQVSKIAAPSQSYAPEEINLIISSPGKFERKMVLYPDRILSFKTDFKTDKVFKIPEGDYKVSVEYAGTTSEATFSIGEKAFVPEQKDTSALITISTDKLQYVPGERTTISASTLKIIPFAGMKFKVFDPNNKQVYDGTLYPDTKGKFSVQIFTSTVKPVFGIYNIVATYDKETVQTTYEVVQDIKEDKPISLTTNKKAYGLGETVTITGRLNQVISQTLEIEIVQPFVNKNIANTFVIKDLIRTKDFGGTGTFKYEFAIPINNDRLGEYKVKVNAPSLDSTEISFLVVENPDEFVDVISGPLSVTTDKPLYMIGDTLVISGKVSEKKDRQNVQISITDENGKSIISKGDPRASAGKNQGSVYFFTGIPDSNGNFEVKSNIYRNIFQKGAYLIKAVYDANTASASFSVDDSIDLGSGVKIIADTDKEVYGIGDQVKLTGGVSTFTAQTSYQITLTDPDGKQTSSGVAIDNGQFSWSWTIPSYLKTFGIYKISIISDSDKIDVFFKISQNPESDTILQPLVVETDKAIYAGGDTITVSGYVVAQTSGTIEGSIVNVRPTITIKTDANKVVYTSTPDLGAGGQFQTSFKIVPAVFKTGEYKVTAKYYKETAHTVFKVDDTFSTGDAAPLVLLLETDKDQYLPGETVTITGKTSKIIHVLDVDVTVSKEGEVKSPIAVKFDSRGSFTYDYKIPQTNSLGTYTVKADTDFDTVVDKFEVVSELPQESTESTGETPETPISATPKKITDKVNRITDSYIPITIEAKDVEDKTYTPRLFDGILRVSSGDESNVNIKLTFDGMCIIGSDSDCQVTKSTRDGSSLYQVVEVDGQNIKVRYSGSDVKLEKFTILPEDSDGVIPSGDWNVEITKDKQISRFYYKISYTSQ